MLLRLLCFFFASSGASVVAQGLREESSVRVWPEKAVLAFGSSIELNCSTSCQNFSSGGLEAPIKKELLGQGSTWKAFKLVNVTEWAPSPLCYFSCGSEKSKTTHASIIVYQAPEQVELDAMPTMEQGTTYNLTCRVPNVAPIRNLTVTLWKGEEKLHLQTFETDTAPEARNIVVTHTIVAQQDNHGQAITCRAALDLRPQGQLFEKASLSKAVKVVAFPMAPVLRTLPSVETNTEMTVECAVVNVFPAQEVQFNLTFAGERLDSNISVLGNTARAQALVFAQSVGKHNLNCVVTLGPVIKSAVKAVQVFSLPSPNLHVDPQEALVNQTVTFVCDSDAAQPQGIVTQIKDTNGILASSYSLPLQFQVTAREEANGKEFTCERVLEIHGDQLILLVKNTSVKLTIFYAPQMNDSTCASTLTWMDGNEETFICSAWGNPKPRVECTKDDVPYTIGVPQRITKEHDGIYHCNATNPYGSVARDVTIHVERYQPNNVLICVVVLIAVAVVSMLGVAYYICYRNQKIRKYWLSNRHARGNPTEQMFLNSNAHPQIV